MGWRHLRQVPGQDRQGVQPVHDRREHGGGSPRHALRVPEEGREQDTEEESYMDHKVAREAYRKNGYAIVEDHRNETIFPVREDGFQEYSIDRYRLLHDAYGDHGE